MPRSSTIENKQVLKFLLNPNCRDPLLSCKRPPIEALCLFKPTALSVFSFSQPMGKGNHPTY